MGYETQLECGQFVYIMCSVMAAATMLHCCGSGLHAALSDTDTYRFLANVNSSSRSLYVIVRPSVCLSVVCDVGAPYSDD